MSMIDPGLFISKTTAVFLLILKQFYSSLFIFQLILGLWWLVYYKGVDSPSTLLPGSVSDGDSPYTKHDSLLFVLLILSALSVLGELYR